MECNLVAVIKFHVSITICSLFTNKITQCGSSSAGPERGACGGTKRGDKKQLPLVPSSAALTDVWETKKPTVNEATASVDRGGVSERCFTAAAADSQVHPRLHVWSHRHRHGHGAGTLTFSRPPGSHSDRQTERLRSEAPSVLRWRFSSCLVNESLRSMGEELSRKDEGGQAKLSRQTQHTWIIRLWPKVFSTSLVSYHWDEF